MTTNNPSTVPSFIDTEQQIGFSAPDYTLKVSHVGPTVTREAPARSGITGQSPVGLLPQQLLGRSAARRSFTIQNTGAVTLWFGFSQNVTVTNGFPLAAGSAPVTFATADELWTVALAALASIAYVALNEDGS